MIISRVITSQWDSLPGIQPLWVNSYTIPGLWETSNSIQELDKKKVPSKSDLLQEVVKKLKPKDDDLNMVLRETLSFEQYERIRMGTQYLSRRETEDILLEKHARGNHVPCPISKLDNYDFDREALLVEVNSLPEDADVNWTDLARRYHVQLNGNFPSNAGHVVKKYCEENGINTEIFNSTKMVSGRDQPYRVKRMKRKIAARVSVPVSKSAKQLKVELKDRIASGEINIGSEIVPKQVVTKGSIERLVHGRHISLQDMVSEELCRLDNEGILLVHPDVWYEELQASNTLQEELLACHLPQSLTAETFKMRQRTIHVKFWHDHASITGASYQAVTYQVLYDPIIHKPASRTGTASQPHVEKPRLCILGRGDSSIAEQMLYMPHRSKDSICTVTHNGLTFQVIPRFVMADYPARAFETGQQIGGKYSCPCGLRATDHTNLALAFSKEHTTLKSKAEVLKQGVAWKKHPYGLKQLSKQDVLEENMCRGLDVGTVYQRPTKVHMLEELQSTLHGISRLPALLTTNPDLNVHDFNKLEVPNCEVLHDYLGVMENITEELPAHEPRLSSLFSSQPGDRMRCIDARFLAISFAKFASEENLPQKILQLAQCLVEITEISYNYAEARTPRKVLRLLNLTLRLAFNLLDIVGRNPKKVSPGKFYGIHFHGLVTHLPELHRLICIRSVIPEQDEALFHQMKQITLNTSSRLPQHVVDNCLSRLSVKRKEAVVTSSTKQQSLLARQGAKVNS